MDIVKTLQSNKTYGILATLVLVIAGIVYYFATAAPQVDVSITDFSSPSNINVNKTDWKKDVYENSLFTSLKSPITLPLVVTEKGKETPFNEGAR